LRVVNIDKKRQRIGLSLKAVTAMEQIEWMAQREIEKAAEEAEAEVVAQAKASADADLAQGEIDSAATEEMEAALGTESAVKEEE
jgi:translation initiation factor 2 alpha subunit (eIF-2alpha)